MNTKRFMWLFVALIVGVAGFIALNIASGEVARAAFQNQTEDAEDNNVIRDGGSYKVVPGNTRVLTGTVRHGNDPAFPYTVTVKASLDGSVFISQSTRLGVDNFTPDALSITPTTVSNISITGGWEPYTGIYKHPYEGVETSWLPYAARREGSIDFDRDPDEVTIVKIVNCEHEVVTCFNRHIFTVAVEPVPPIPVMTTTIAGPTEVYMGELVTYTLSAYPATATLPVEWFVRVNGQDRDHDQDYEPVGRVTVITITFTQTGALEVWGRGWNPGGTAYFPTLTGTVLAGDPLELENTVLVPLVLR